MPSFGRYPPISLPIKFACLSSHQPYAAFAPSLVPRRSILLRSLREVWERVGENWWASLRRWRHRSQWDPGLTEPERLGTRLVCPHSCRWFHTHTLSFFNPWLETNTKHGDITRSLFHESKQVSLSHSLLLQKWGRTQYKVGANSTGRETGAIPLQGKGRAGGRVVRREMKG